MSDVRKGVVGWSGCSMRTRIFIAVGLVVLVGLLLAFERLTARRCVSIGFMGYSTNGAALFKLKNGTRLPMTHSYARVQVPTQAGWTNYYSLFDEIGCRHGDFWLDEFS